MQYSINFTIQKQFLTMSIKSQPPREKRIEKPFSNFLFIILLYNLHYFPTKKSKQSQNQKMKKMLSTAGKQNNVVF